MLQWAPKLWHNNTNKLHLHYIYILPKQDWKVPIPQPSRFGGYACLVSARSRVRLPPGVNLTLSLTDKVRSRNGWLSPILSSFFPHFRYDNLNSLAVTVPSIKLIYFLLIKKVIYIIHLFDIPHVKLISYCWVHFDTNRCRLVTYLSISLTITSCFVHFCFNLFIQTD
jgi:hypothetical protein